MAETRSKSTHVVCSNLVVDERGVLLVRESKPSALGRWSLPGGRLETGESLAECAAREAAEETGLVVDAERLVGIYHCPATLEGGSAISFVFASTITGGEIRPTAEHPEVAFHPRRELDALIATRQVRGTHVPFALRAHDAGVSIPLDLVTEVPASGPPTS